MNKGFALVVTAAGSSERFNSGKTTRVKKEYLKVGEHTVIYSAVAPFLSFPSLRTIVITIPKGQEEAMREALGTLLEKTTVPCLFIEGGNSRTQSVRNAILALDSGKAPFDYIAIHDGARPFVTEEIIREALKGAEAYGGAAPGLVVSDAVKRINQEGLVEENLDRSGMVRVQTPQIFERSAITRMYKEAKEGAILPDDIELYTSNGGRCLITKGSEENRKITFLDDIPEAEAQIEDYIRRHQQ